MNTAQFEIEGQDMGAPYGWTTALKFSTLEVTGKCAWVCPHVGSTPVIKPPFLCTLAPSGAHPLLQAHMILAIEVTLQGSPGAPQVLEGSQLLPLSPF